MSSVNPAARRASRIKLLALVAVFALPVVAAAVWYFALPGLAPAPSVHGELIDPARPLEPFELDTGDGEAVTLETMRGHWTLLHPVGARCDSVCRERLYYTRQVRDALGEDRIRVERVAVASGGKGTPGLEGVRDEHPRLRLARPGTDRPLLAQLPGEHPPGTVYLVDPLGNLVLRFGPEVTADAILDDLEHLLKLSRIG